MRELKGEKDLQLAKDVLIAFENKHYPNQQATSDIQEGLYWFEAEDEYYSADLGSLLRGEGYEEVRIVELTKEEEWLPNLNGWCPVAFVDFQDKLYFFYI